MIKTKQNTKQSKTKKNEYDEVSRCLKLSSGLHLDLNNQFLSNLLSEKLSKNAPFRF